MGHIWKIDKGKNKQKIWYLIKMSIEAYLFKI